MGCVINCHRNASAQGVGVEGVWGGGGWWEWREGEEGEGEGERRGGRIKQCHWNPQCCESPIPFSFIKPISRRGELREEALNLSGGNNGALKG